MQEDWIIVEAPDGTEIEFPSSMSDEDISNVMRQQYPPGEKFLNVMDKMGMGAPTQQQFQNEIAPNIRAKAQGYDYTLRKMGEDIIQNKMNDPENVGWTPGGRSPESFAANKLGRAEGTYLGFGDETLGLINKEAGDFKHNLKKHAQFMHPQEFGEGQVEGNVFSGIATLPVSAPRWLQLAKFMPRGTQAVTAGASGAAAWDTIDQLGTSEGTIQQRVRDIDTDRTKTAAGVGGAAGGVLSAFTRTLSNGQSELGSLLEGLVDDAGRVSDDGVRAFESFIRDNRISLDDVSRRFINDAVEEGLQVPSKSLALPVRVKDILIDAFEDGSGKFRQAVETQLRGTMVEGGEGAARIAQSVDEDVAASRVALDENYGRVLGKKARIKSEDQTKEQLAEIGREGYEPVLSKDLTYQDARALDEVLSGPGMSKLKSPLEEIAAGEGISLEDMIQTSPLRAAHWMQSKARQLADSSTDVVKSNAFGALRTRLLSVINEVAPDYDKVRRQYGDEFGNLQALEFGDKFLRQARDAFQIDRMKRAFSDLSPKQKNVALLSVRDALRSASGRGQRGSAPRLTQVADEQVLDSLEYVFGKRGARVASGIEEIKDFVQSRQRIDSRRGSPTASNQEAVDRATRAVQSPLRRKVGNLMQNIAGDVAYTSSGFPAINSIRKSIGKAGEVVSGDVSNKMNALATLLEAKVAQPLTAKPKRSTPPRGPDGKFISRQAVAQEAAIEASEPTIMDLIAAKGKPSERGGITFGKKRSVNPDEFFTDSQKGSAVMSPEYPSNAVDDALQRMGTPESQLGQRVDDGIIGLRRAMNESADQFEQMVANNPGKQSYVFSLPDDPRVGREAVERLLKYRDQMRWGPSKRADTVLVMSADGGDLALVDRALTNRGGPFAITEATQGAGVNWFRLNDLADFDAVPGSAKNVATRGNRGILGNQRGNIVIDGRPMRRQDAMREARAAGGGSFPTEQPATPPQQPPSLPPRRSNLSDSPLLPLLGIGAAGTAGTAGINYMNRPDASGSDGSENNAFISGIMRNANTALDDITTRREQGLPKTPGLKPRRQIDRTADLAQRQRIEDAIRAETQRSEEYWKWLGQYGQAGDRLLWNKIKQKRARELTVTPDDRANGIQDKRLPYSYETPVSALETAPIELLIDGQWISEAALEGAR